MVKMNLINPAWSKKNITCFIVSPIHFVFQCAVNYFIKVYLTYCDSFFNLSECDLGSTVVSAPSVSTSKLGKKY